KTRSRPGCSSEGHDATLGGRSRRTTDSRIVAVVSGGARRSARQRNLAVPTSTRSVAVSELVTFEAHGAIKNGHRDAGSGGERAGQSPSTEDLVQDVGAAEVMTLPKRQVIDEEHVEHVPAVKERRPVVAVRIEVV